MAETQCCPQFDPLPWDGKEINWENKTFIKDKVVSVFHIPVNFGTVVMKNVQKIESAGISIPDNMMLTDEKSLWGADVYFAVEKEVPDSENITISGKFLTKVFEGPFKNVPVWIKEMNEYVTGQGKTAKNQYCWYTTCPKCAKEYGKNYVVIFSQVE